MKFDPRKIEAPATKPRLEMGNEAEIHRSPATAGRRWIKRPSTPSLITFVIAVAVGFLIVGQFFSTNQVKEITAPDQQNNLALEVSILSDSNTTLRQEVDNLEQKQRNYQEALLYRLPGTDVLQASLNQDKKVSGLQELSGAGVALVIDGPILDVQLLDLLNTLRNIGVEGIAINGHRVTYKSTIRPQGLQITLDGQVLTPPYRFEAVGDAELLVSSLQREGGILEQIKQVFPDVSVGATKKADVVLPAYPDKISFRYARAVE